MALVRYRNLGGWNPVSDLMDLMDLGSRRFANFDVGDGATRVAWHPPVDMYEDNDMILVRMDLPGMKKDEIDISFDGHILSITGTRQEKELNGNGSYWSRERFTGEFHRYVHIPAEVSSEGLVATFTDGVLEVSLPKKESSRLKKIPIESGEAPK